MSKKKKSRKHRRQAVHTDSPASVAAAPAQPKVGAATPAQTQVQAPKLPNISVKRPAATLDSTANARWDYVSGDLKRVGVIVLACVAIELVLWYVLGTSAGSRVYDLIKL